MSTTTIRANEYPYVGKEFEIFLQPRGALKQPLSERTLIKNPRRKQIIVKVRIIEIVPPVDDEDTNSTEAYKCE